MPGLIRNDTPTTVLQADGDHVSARADAMGRTRVVDDLLTTYIAAHLGPLGGLVVEGVARFPIVDVATGAAAIAKSSAVHTTAFLLHSVTVHFNAAPTTSENLTVTLNAVATAPYDTVLCKVNPSVGALTDIVYMPDVPLLCQAGDVIDVAFTNTDTKTYGVRIVTEDV